MIQNIAENLKEENKVKEKKSTKSRYIDFADLFSKQNVLIYILTFMISEVSLGQNREDIIAPFGIALAIAAISNSIPALFVFLAGLIGSFVKFGWSQTAFFALTFLAFLIMYLIKKPAPSEEGEKKLNLGAYTFFSVLIASFLKMLVSGFYFYDILIVLIYSISAYIFYKIFNGSITVISDYEKKQVFSIEEVIGASLMVAIAISAFGKLSILGFSLRNIICIFMVLVLGWRNGVLVGSASGITVGIVLGIISDGNPTLIAAYAISGMIAGLLNKFGKIGVIVGFILGNVIIAYSANGGTKNIIMFQEILIAACGLLALPKNTKFDIESILPKTKMLPAPVGKIEASPETMLKLDSISETISQMSKSYQKDTSYENNLKAFEFELQKSMPDLENNILYDYVEENFEKLAKDVFDYIIKEGVLTQNGMVAIFAKNNIYILNSDEDKSDVKMIDSVREVVKFYNSAFNTCKKDLIWQKKIIEKNKNVSQELNNVKNAIDSISKGIESENSAKNVDKFFEKEEEIKNQLLKTGVDVIGIKIYQDEIQKEKDRVDNKEIEYANSKSKSNTINYANPKINQNNKAIETAKTGRMKIEIVTNLCDDETGEKCPVKQIKRVIETALKKEFYLQNQICGIRQSLSKCTFTFLENDKYVLQTGIATAKKYSSIVSGDSISKVRLGDGKYLLAISDGMGSGPDARKNSKIATSMLERLLNSGFDKNTSINLINSAIINANSEEMYATLDVEIFDLYTAKAEFLKNAACPTYIKRNRNVKEISANSLPAGILNNAKVDCFDIDLQDGDIVVICSDGIIESNTEYDNKELWVKNLLEEIQTDIPERIANIILKESVDNSVGRPRDDMSVIVAKIIKK